MERRNSKQTMRTSLTLLSSRHQIGNIVGAWTHTMSLNAASTRLQTFNSTESKFDSFANLSLKPLLRFITAECLSFMQSTTAREAGELHIVDFVVRLLQENKESLEQACRLTDVSAGGSRSAAIAYIYRII